MCKYIYVYSSVSTRCKMFIYMYIFENSSVWTEPICFAYEAERSLLLMGLLDPYGRGRERGGGP